MKWQAHGHWEVKCNHCFRGTHSIRDENIEY